MKTNEFETNWWIIFINDSYPFKDQHREIISNHTQKKIEAVTKTTVIQQIFDKKSLTKKILAQ